MSRTETILDSTRARLCLACGKCTAVCPVSRMGGDYSPRRFVEQIVTGRSSPLAEMTLWDCLTCKACEGVCPSDVSYGALVRGLRALEDETKTCAHCTHGDVIGAWADLMGGGAKLNRLAWLEDAPDLRVSDASDTVLFVGCLPFYAPIFEPIGAECLGIARAALRLLNAMGIEPQVQGEEVCCGHDQLWAGYMATFRSLAAHNVQLLRDSGARRVVTACPECAYMLKVVYPQHVGEVGLEVLHPSELLAQQPTLCRDGRARGGRRVTFHDPCRLGRYLDIYDAPRDALMGAGFEVVEMQDSHRHATCCGSSLWINCGAVNKRIQVERLRQAAATGAEVLVTACAKCQIHFRCAMDDPDVRDEIQIEVRDMATLIADVCNDGDEREIWDADKHR